MSDIPDLIGPDDLSPFANIASAKAEAMIDDATGQALTVAPCLAEDLTPVQRKAVKGILRTAILRWNDAGSGGKVSSQLSAGPFQQSDTIDTTQQRRGVFYPSEIRALQAICKRKPAPYAIDMGARQATPHTPWCARSMGANYCDCGAELGMNP